MNFPKLSFELTPEQLKALEPFTNKVVTANPRYAVQGNVWLNGPKAGTVDCFLINESAYYIIDEAIQRAKSAGTKVVRRGK
jgi:hypothetical protein